LDTILKVPVSGTNKGQFSIVAPANSVLTITSVEGAGSKGDVKGAGSKGDVKGAGSKGDVKGAGSKGDVKGAGSKGDVKGAGSKGDVNPTALATSERSGDGAIADGAVADGAIADGAIADGAIADGAVADGAVADGAIADGDLPIIPDSTPWSTSYCDSLTNYTTDKGIRFAMDQQGKVSTHSLCSLHQGEVHCNIQ
jgi:hypothetical protein